jgi:hypothetical protein
VRAGPARAALWAIHPTNSLFLSDAALTGSIHQMLTAHGPLTIEQFALLTELTGLDCQILETFMQQHTAEYTRESDGSFWFAGHTRPSPCNFDSMGHALLWAFSEFPEGASVEEMHWLLCLSTVGGTKKITRRSISRELSRRTDLFAHASRARYIPLRNVEVVPQFAQMEMEMQVMNTEPNRQTFPSVVWGDSGTMGQESLQIMPAAPCPVHEEEDEFNPFTFFNGGFEFAHP